MNRLKTGGAFIYQAHSEPIPPPPAAPFVHSTNNQPPPGMAPLAVGLLTSFFFTPVRQPVPTQVPYVTNPDRVTTHAPRMQGEFAYVPAINRWGIDRGQPPWLSSVVPGRAPVVVLGESAYPLYIPPAVVAPDIPYPVYPERVLALPVPLELRGFSVYPLQPPRVPEITPPVYPDRVLVKQGDRYGSIAYVPAINRWGLDKGEPPWTVSYPWRFEVVDNGAQRMPFAAYNWKETLPAAPVDLSWWSQGTILAPRGLPPSPVTGATFLNTTQDPVIPPAVTGTETPAATRTLVSGKLYRRTLTRKT